MSEEPLSPIDKKCDDLTGGRHLYWSDDQPKKDCTAPEFYYLPEFCAVSLAFPYLDQQRQVEILRYFHTQFLRQRSEFGWSCFGVGLDDLIEDLLADTDACSQVLPEYLASFDSGDLPLMPDKADYQEESNPIDQDDVVDIHPDESFPEEEEEELEELLGEWDEELEVSPPPKPKSMSGMK